MTQILGLWSTAPCREITCQRASEECIIEVVPKLPLASAYHETTKSDISKCRGNSQWCVCSWAHIQPRQKHSNVNMEVLEEEKKWGVWRNESALFLWYLIAHIPHTVSTIYERYSWIEIHIISCFKQRNRPSTVDIHHGSLTELHNSSGGSRSLMLTMCVPVHCGGAVYGTCRSVEWRVGM